MRTKILILGIFLGLSFIILGCDKRIYYYYDDCPPSTPKGLYSITGDERVYLYWYENDEENFDEYWVYRKRDGESHYRRIGRTTIAEYVDKNVVNGRTYWYRVSAVNWYGEESDLSESAFDTPRPEGWDEIIQDFNRYPNSSGFDFSREQVVRYDDPRCDIYLEYYDGIFYLCVRDAETDIQDFGYKDDIDSVDYSPEVGWSALWCVEVIKGHSYIIWTRDDHYAKLRVADFTRSYGILFDWAYQVDPGNQELKPGPPKLTDLRKEKENRGKINLEENGGKR